MAHTATEPDFVGLDTLKRDDMMSVIAMENYDAYGDYGFGEAFRFRVDDVVRSEPSAWSDEGATGVTIFGSLLDQPSWMRRKQIKFVEGAWKMDLGGDYGWSMIALAKAGD